MDLEQKARSLAALYFAHVIKGHDVNFVIHTCGGPIFKVAEVPLNRGDHGCCDYLDNQQVLDLEDSDKKAIIAQTTDGFTHVFVGEVYSLGDGLNIFDPLIFLGEISV